MRHSSIVLILIHVCAYVCVCVCVDACVCVCVDTCVYVCADACVYACIDMCTYVLIHLCMHVFTYMCVCADVYVYVCVDVCMCLGGGDNLPKSELDKELLEPLITVVNHKLFKAISFKDLEAINVQHPNRELSLVSLDTFVDPQHQMLKCARVQCLS